MVRIPRTLVWFAVINGFAFAVDLSLVTAVHGGLGWPVPVAVTIGYAVALTLGFGLNKRLNFRSPAPVGPEGVRYAGVAAVNFGVVLLGATTALDALGVQYQVARVAAGLCEGAFMYAALRWFVFRSAPGGVSSRASAPAAPASRPPRDRAAR